MNCINCGHGQKSHMRVNWKMFLDGKCEGKKDKCQCKEWKV